MAQRKERPRGAAPGAWLQRHLALVAVIILVACISAAGRIALRTHPDLAGQAVDVVRGIVGPRPVAWVENVYYRGADTYNRLRFRVTGDTDGWQLAAAPAPSPGPAAGPTAPGAPILPILSEPSRPASTNHADQLQPAPVINAALSGSQPAPCSPAAPAPTNGLSGGEQPANGSSTATRGTPVAPVSTSSTTAVVAQKMEPLRPVSPTLAGPALPGEGIWQPLGTSGQPTGAPPILWQTTLRPDPDRPFARVALVAMDLSRSQLHILPGTVEPASQVPARALRAGTIPADVQSGGGLVAAWNGGFKAVHGHFGMMTDGVTWLPAQAGLATIAIAENGTALLGEWGRGIRADQPWLAWRQNDPPLIENGQVTPDVIKYANTVRWGASVDGAVFIWRSGMGLTHGGRWLIYAAGNSLSAATLAGALAAAGAWDGMQLDVNATWERFVTFRAVPQTVQSGGKTLTLPLTAQKLIDQMAAGPTQFLLPDERDFFYLTAK